VALSSPAAACLYNALRWLVVAFSAKQKEQRTPPAANQRQHHLVYVYVSRQLGLISLIYRTAGCTIFPYFVAIVHTALYVDLYHYYRRWTLAKVPRLSPFPPLFLSNRSFTIFMNIDPIGVVGHGLSTTAHAWKTLFPRQRACCPHHGGLPTRSVRSNLSRGGR
jgi:hypothetical protein